MSKSKRKRWKCDICDVGVLAPSRMRKSDVRKYCIPCSEETGHLVERVCPALEKKRAQSKAKAAAKARAERAKKAARPDERLYRLWKKWAPTLKGAGLTVSTVSVERIAQEGKGFTTRSVSVLLWHMVKRYSPDRHRGAFADAVAALWPDLPPCNSMHQLDLALWRTCRCIECDGRLKLVHGVSCCMDCGGAFDRPTIEAAIHEQRRLR